MKKNILLIIFSTLLFYGFAQEEPALRSAIESAEGVAQNGQEEESFNDSEISLNKENGTYDSQETESLDRLERGGDLPHLYTYINTPLVEQRQVYNRDKIDQMHVENLTSFFEGAGIQILSYGPYGLEQKPSIRGFTDETVRVVIDGVCVNNPQYGTFDFSSINIESIERIEIVRGGFTEGVAEDSAVAGVIYISTKNQGIGHHFNTDSMFKTFFYGYKPVDTFSQSFYYNGQIYKNDFLKAGFKATAAANEFLYKNYLNRLDIRKNSSVYDANVNLGYSHYFGSGNSISFSDLVYAGYKHTPGTKTSTLSGIQQDYNNNICFTLNCPSIIKNFTFNSNLSWISNNRFFDQSSESSKHYVNTFTFNSLAEFTKFKNYKQSAGFNLELTKLISTDDGNHLQFSGIFKETSKFIISKHFNISIPLGIKFSGNNFAFTPKIGFKFPFKYVDFVLSGYRMVQFPNMDDLYWDGAGYKGNPNLLPEDGYGAELTFNVHNIFIPFSFCIYSNYYQNKIQWSNQNSIWSAYNISSAYYLGFNLSFEKTLFKIWNLKGNFEYLYNALLNKNNSLTYGNRIMWTPDLVFSIISTLNFNKFTVLTEINYTGKKYISNLNIDYVDPYCLVNIALDFDIWKNVKPYLRVDNLFNTDYESVPDYPMPGISLSLGVKCNW